MHKGCWSARRFSKPKGSARTPWPSVSRSLTRSPQPRCARSFGPTWRSNWKRPSTLGSTRWAWISSDSIESLFGVAKQHGVGQTQDAARIALRLPALCGVPTREEAEQVLEVRVARQQEITDQFISLTQQRREVLGHPERLESLNQNQGAPHVELMPRPKNRSNHDLILNISTSCENRYGPQLGYQDNLVLLENTGPPDIREAALT